MNWGLVGVEGFRALKIHDISVHVCVCSIGLSDTAMETSQPDKRPALRRSARLHQVLHT